MKKETSKKRKVNKKKLRDILTEDEKVLYEKVLEDIAENEEFYATSNADEITSHLIDECGFDKHEIYNLFKKIAQFSEE